MSTTAPPRQVHPKIRERRADVARNRARRRLWIALVILGVVVTAVGAAAALRSPLFDVDRVVVTGTARTSGDTVLRVTGLDLRPQLIDVDTAEARRALTALPWVRRASVRREWPGTVRIRVWEREPAAAVPAIHEGRWAIVDRDGWVLTDEPSPSGLVPVVEGRPAGRPGTRLDRRTRAGVAVAAALPDELRERVEAVVLADDGVQLRLGGGGVARLGGATDLEAKFDAVLTVLSRVDTERLRVLDARVPEAPVLTRD